MAVKLAQFSFASTTLHHVPQPPEALAGLARPNLTTT